MRRAGWYLGFGLWALGLWLLAAGAGCSSVGVYAPGLESGVEAAIDAGLPVRVSTDPDAPISVSVRRDLQGLAGHAYDTRGCQRGAYVLPGVTPSVVAHEIGHTLGLRHSEDPKNVMHTPSFPDSGTTTSSQRSRAKIARNALTLCGAAQ